MLQYVGKMLQYNFIGYDIVTSFPDEIKHIHSDLCMIFFKNAKMETYSMEPVLESKTKPGIT